MTPRRDRVGADEPTSAVRRGGLMLVLATLLIALIVWLGREKDEPRAPAYAPAAPSAKGPAAASSPVIVDYRPALARQAPVEPSAKPRTPAEQRLDRAQEVLAAYLESTKYPPESQPMRRNPDQERPHWVPQVTHPLVNKDGKPLPVALVQKQDRRYLVGDETAELSMRCESNATARPCDVLSAVAVRFDKQAPPGAPVSFTLGSDGWHKAFVQPAKQGLAGWFGPIMVYVTVQHGNDLAEASFQLDYTPEAPATFTGAVSDAIENGSLVLSVGMTIKQPGRYFVVGRVVDAQGEDVALVSFDQALDVGAQTAKLTVFGKLLRDEAPTFPLRLRDVEGYRFLEFKAPDREILRALEGVVHTTKSWPLASFADAEWQSDERTRHVTEFTKDVDLAKTDVDKERGAKR